MSDNFKMGAVETNVRQPKESNSKYAATYYVIFNTDPDKWHRAKVDDEKQTSLFITSLRGHAKRNNKKVITRIMNYGGEFFMYWKWTEKEG